MKLRRIFIGALICVIYSNFSYAMSLQDIRSYLNKQFGNNIEEMAKFYATANKKKLQGVKLDDSTTIKDIISVGTDVIMIRSVNMKIFKEEYKSAIRTNVNTFFRRLMNQEAKTNIKNLCKDSFTYALLEKGITIKYLTLNENTVTVYSQNINLNICNNR